MKLASGAAAGYHGVVRIIILSGLSGSGKSVALHMLEDLGFYCIDNIPAALLKPFIPKINFVVEGGALPQIKFPRISIPHGMSVMEALELPLRSVGG